MNLKFKAGDIVKVVEPDNEDLSRVGRITMQEPHYSGGYNNKYNYEIEYSGEVGWNYGYVNDDEIIPATKKEAENFKQRLVENSI